MRTVIFATLSVVGACFGGGDEQPQPTCTGRDPAPCLDGACYATCPDGPRDSTPTLMKTDFKPPLDEVLDGETVDITGDGIVDDMDRMGGVDFDEDGTLDNRYYFDDRSVWVPDADSFDDYENPDLDIPRGVTPVSAECEADGIATGPPILQFDDYVPSSYCVRVVMIQGEAPCILGRR